MKPENRRNVAKFLSVTKEVTEAGWEETRLAMRWNNSIFIIEDNFPEWTMSQVLDFCNSQPGIEIFNLTVRVTPNE